MRTAHSHSVFPSLYLRSVDGVAGRPHDKRSDLERVAAVGLGLRRVELVAPLVDFDQVRAEVGVDDGDLADGGSANTGGGVGWVAWGAWGGRTQAERTAAAASGAGESRMGSQRGRAHSRRQQRRVAGHSVRARQQGGSLLSEGAPVRGVGARAGPATAHAGLKT